ncbi:MAG: hypothetical protein IPK72_17180 [Candidatus Eisenbacteria bacterium]|nr:hypothetical protein [Candidatus Eisenbacteria bacterium]
MDVPAKWGAALALTLLAGSLGDSHDRFRPISRSWAEVAEAPKIEPDSLLLGPVDDFEAREVPPPPPLPPGDARREAAPGPLTWKSIHTTVHVIDPRVRWQIAVEECSPGTLIAFDQRRPLRQTRLRISRAEGRGAKAGATLGLLMHLDNLEVALLPPDDPRVTAAPTVQADSLNPWPNTCGLEVRELEHPIDLDLDGRQEVIVKRYATIAGRAASGLLVLAADQGGRPVLLPLPSIVRGLRSESLQLQDLHWNRKDLQPTLVCDHLGLVGCGFLNEVGIRGEAQCEDCCQVTILLQRATDLFYHPNYVRDRQLGQLDRLRSDLKEIAIGDPAQALTSYQEASLARAAAFLYLTGAGPRARETLITALGPRAATFRPRLLLDRLERYFTPVDSTIPPAGPDPAGQHDSGR